MKHVGATFEYVVRGCPPVFATGFTVPVKLIALNDVHTFILANLYLVVFCRI